MKKFLTLSLMLVMWTGLSALTIDQNHTGLADFYHSIDLHESGQSFIPSTNGPLVQIDINVSASLCASNPSIDRMKVLLRVREGDGLDGPAISKDTFELTLPFKRQYIGIRPKERPFLIEGMKYTISLEVIAEDFCDNSLSRPNAIKWYHSGKNSYYRGRAIVHASVSDEDYFFKTYIDRASGDDELGNHDWKLSALPNPTSGIIRLTSINPNEDLSLELFDASGRRTDGYQVLDQGNSLDLSDLNSGLYLLSVTNGSERQVIRVMKR